MRHYGAVRQSKNQYKDRSNICTRGECNTSWKFYESITKETQKAREHKQQVVVLGDFNVKVGTTIQVNKETITKARRLLLKMIQKETMSLFSADKH